MSPAGRYSNTTDFSQFANIRLFSHDAEIDSTASALEQADK
jgi:hypothetical protein